MSSQIINTPTIAITVGGVSIQAEEFSLSQNMLTFDGFTIRRLAALEASAANVEAYLHKLAVITIVALGRSTTYKGIVTSIEVKRSPNKSVLEVFIKGKGLMYILNRAHASEYYPNPNGDYVEKANKNLEIVGFDVASIVKEVAEKELKPEVGSIVTMGTEKTPLVARHIIRHDETAYQFLVRLAFVLKRWFYFDGTKIIFGEMEDKAVLPLVLRSNLLAIGQKPYDDLDALDEDMSLEESDVPLGDRNNQAYEGLTIFNYRKLTRENQHVRGTAYVPLTVGDHVTIDYSGGANISGPLSGTYIIINCRHAYDELKIYRCYFTAVPKGESAWEFGLPNIKLPNPTYELARVINDVDPLGLDRTQVRFFWQDPKNDTNDKGGQAKLQIGTGRTNVTEEVEQKDIDTSGIDVTETFFKGGTLLDVSTQSFTEHILAPIEMNKEPFTSENTPQFFKSENPFKDNLGENKAKNGTKDVPHKGASRNDDDDDDEVEGPGPDSSTLPAYKLSGRSSALHPWLRVTTEYAGGNMSNNSPRGFMFKPDKGDVVLLGYRMNHNVPLFEPYVVGSTFGLTVPFPCDVNNDEKRIVTNSGIVIIINEAEESILIGSGRKLGQSVIHPPDSYMYIDKKGNITIFAKEEFNARASFGMNINSDSTISYHGDIAVVVASIAQYDLFTIGMFSSAALASVSILALLGTDFFTGLFTNIYALGAVDISSLYFLVMKGHGYHRVNGLVQTALNPTVSVPLSAGRLLSGLKASPTAGSASSRIAPFVGFSILRVLSVTAANAFIFNKSTNDPKKMSPFKGAYTLNRPKAIIPITGMNRPPAVAKGNTPPPVMITPTPTPTLTPSVSATPTSSASVTPTPSISITPSVSATPTSSASVTPTPSISITPSVSATPMSSASVTPTPSISMTPSVSATPTSSVSATLTPTPS